MYNLKTMTEKDLWLALDKVRAKRQKKVKAGFSPYQEEEITDSILLELCVRRQLINQGEDEIVPATLEEVAEIEADYEDHIETVAVWQKKLDDAESYEQLKIVADDILIIIDAEIGSPLEAQIESAWTATKLRMIIQDIIDTVL